MSKTPDISLIMSVYNGEDYLAEAIESVVNQTFTNWELVVINDCSTDSTAEILNKYALSDNRIKVHTNEVNLRLPSSLNKALTLVEGKYVARMDADDICLPDRLEKQYDFMEKNPDVALSSCRFITLKNNVYSSGGCGGKCDSESVKALLLVTNPILHPGIIAKAEVIKELKYDKEFTCTEDMELWTRFVMSGYKVENLSEYLMIYRLHDKQITKTTLEKQYTEVIRIQKKYFGKFLKCMNELQKNFYTHGIYFKEKTDCKKFRKFYRWIKSVNSKTKAFDKDALNYAMFEVLAEYKRKGIGKIELLRTMMPFGMPFLLKEFKERKKRAYTDGLNCIESAKKVELEYSGGTVEFPTFSKRNIQEF